jgi:hypothetical protein
VPPSTESRHCRRVWKVGFEVKEAHADALDRAMGSIVLDMHMIDISNASRLVAMLAAAEASST